MVMIVLAAAMAAAVRHAVAMVSSFQWLSFYGI